MVAPNQCSKALTLENGCERTTAYQQYACATPQYTTLVGALLNDDIESSWINLGNSDAVPTIRQNESFDTAKSPAASVRQEATATAGVHNTEVQSHAASPLPINSSAAVGYAYAAQLTCSQPSMALHVARHDAPLLPAHAFTTGSLHQEERDLLADLEELLNDTHFAHACSKSDNQSADSGHNTYATLESVLSNRQSSVPTEDSNRPETEWRPTDSSATSTVSTLTVSSASSECSGATVPCGRRRGRKRCASPSTRRERKRQQNREAAQRYRDRKQGQVGTLDSELEREQERNRTLHDALRHAEAERRILLRVADRFDLLDRLRRELTAAQAHDGAATATTNELAVALHSLEKLITRKLQVPFTSEHKTLTLAAALSSPQPITAHYSRTLSADDAASFNAGQSFDTPLSQVFRRRSDSVQQTVTCTPAKLARS